MKTVVKTKTISGTKVLIATCLAIGFLAVANAFLPPSLTNIQSTYWGQQGDCNESDGGYNPNEKGALITGGGYVRGIDTCVNEFGRPASESKFLLETQCGTDGGYVENTIECQSWCKNGACLDFPLGPVCNDADGGKNFLESSHITWPNGSVDLAQDTCLNSPGDDTPMSEGNFLREYFCAGNPAQGQSSLQYEDIQCQCIDGSCIPQATNKDCTDSDGGKNLFTKGSVTPFDSGWTGHPVFDTCADWQENAQATTPLASTEGAFLVEYYCDRSNYDGYRLDFFACPNGCADGICINNCDGTMGDISGDGYVDYRDEALIKDMISGTIPSDPCGDMNSNGVIGPGDLATLNQQMYGQGCIDSDGANFDQVGTVTMNGQFFGTDECGEGGYLKEHLCQDNKPVTITKRCYSGCENGICKFVNDWPRNTCTETDDGIDIYNFSTISIDGNPPYDADTCFDYETYQDVTEGSFLKETYCIPQEDKSSVGTNAVLEPFECPHGCKNGACININVGDTRTYTCNTKPGGESTTWNQVDSYQQTWNGTKWFPKDDPVTDYSTSSGPRSRKSCQYKCAEGRTGDGNSCTSEMLILNLNVNSPSGPAAPNNAQDMLYIDITNDSYLNQEITTLFFKLQPNLYTFQVKSCQIQNLETNTIYNPSIEPHFYSGISYFNFTNLNIAIEALETITVNLVCDTSGTTNDAGEVVVQPISTYADGLRITSTQDNFPINGGQIIY